MADLFLGRPRSRRYPKFNIRRDIPIFHGDYKALRLGAWLQSTGVEGAGEWQLYDLKKDPSELHDLAEREPDRLAEMVMKYAEYSASVGVIDVPADFNPVSTIAGGK